MPAAAATVGAVSDTGAPPQISPRGDGRPAGPWGTTVTPGIVALAVIADALLVILFAALGRRSHEESEGILGTLSTAWPFLVGLAVGWLIVLALLRRTPRIPHPLRAWPVGVTVWIATVLCGMLLRAATGEGTALAFVLVATGFNLLTLVGWRLLAQLAAARRR